MATKCTVPGCKRPQYAKELCGAHYRRQLRDPSAAMDPVRESRGELVDLSTRVPAEVRDALDAAGGAYAVAASVLEAWASGRSFPKRPAKSRRAA